METPFQSKYSTAVDLSRKLNQINNVSVMPQFDVSVHTPFKEIIEKMKQMHCAVSQSVFSQGSKGKQYSGDSYLSILWCFMRREGMRRGLRKGLRKGLKRSDR